MTPIDNIIESDFDFIIKQTQQTRGVAKAPLKISTISAEHTEKEKTFTEIKDYRVGHLFYPIVVASKYIGFCPVKIIRKRDDSIVYEFKWLSIQFLITFIWAAFTFFLAFTWTLNAIFDISWPAKLFSHHDKEDDWLNENLLKGSQLIIVLNNFIKVSLPIGAWVSLVLSWGDVRSLCDFLNDWPAFIYQYNCAFSSYYTVKFYLKQVRLTSILICLAPMIFLMATIRPVNYLQDARPILNYLFGYSQIIVMLGTRALSYIKDFLPLQTIKVAYIETLNGIKAEYGKCQKTISRDQVREWMEMVNFIRKQAARVESHISAQNLWSVFEIFTSVLLILSMAVFLFMNNALAGGLQGNFLPFSLVCTIFFVCSLFWKTELAEQIASKEEEIAEELLEMETGDDDCETRLEMKLICDVIYNDPVKIQVGHVLTLNKRLLLSFFSQLASYLVVILQFTKT